MAYEIITSNNNIFQSGKIFTFPVKIQNDSTVDAENVAVTFLSIVDTTTGQNVMGLLNIAPETAVPQGSFAGTVWTVGTRTGGTTLTHNFTGTILSDDITRFEITYVLSTTTAENNVDDNGKTYKWNGTPYSIISVGNEEIYNIPFEAFSNTDNPTEEEVKTWVDGNLTDIQKQNGTVLTYGTYTDDGLPPYQDFVIVIDTTLGTAITNIDLNYTIGNTSFDITSSAAFDEAAFQTYIEGLMTTAGVTGTVSVTDNIDGTDTITLNITGQDGIWRFNLWIGFAKIYYPATVDKSSELFHREKPNYIYQLNNDEGDYTITNIFKDKEGLVGGNKFFIDMSVGSDEEGEPYSRLYPYKTLDYVVHRLARPNDRIYINYNSGSVDYLNIRGMDISGIEIYINFENITSGFLTSVIIGEHTSDADTSIYIDGYILVPFNYAPVNIAHTSYLNRSLILGANKGLTCILNGGSTPTIDTITSSVGSKEIVIHDVRTNSEILDASALEVGNLIVRNPNFK